MTILVAQIVPEGVIITADTKLTNLDINGNSLGTFSNVEKISAIRSNMIMASAGLGSLGKSIIDLLNAILAPKNIIPVEQALAYIKDTLNYGYSNFKSINPEVTYLNLVAFIAGYDIEKKSPFIYASGADNNFELINYTDKGLITIGPSNDIVSKHIASNVDKAKDYDDMVKLHAEAIRMINNDEVSKDTYSICLVYDGQLIRSREFKVNESGILTFN